MTTFEQEYARTFICIPVPQQTRSVLSDINQFIRSESTGLSCPDPRHAHITLAFLGRISGPPAREIADGLDRVCSQINSFSCELGAGGFFGSRKRPRVLLAGMAAVEELMGLQRQIADVVRHAGVALEDRPFEPHLTIARVRSSLPPDSLTSIISFINNTNFAEIMVDHVLFINSRLNGPGPRFTTIHQAHLKGS